MVFELENKGVKNTVVVPAFYGAEVNYCNAAVDVRVINCFNKIDRVSFFYKQSKIYKAVINTINPKEYDCIHAHTLFTDGNCAYKMSKQYGIPFVVAVRNTDVNDFFGKRKYLKNRGVKILLNASAVIFLSDSYKEKVINSFVPKKIKGEVLKKSFVIPNGIDDFWFENQWVKSFLDVKDRIYDHNIHLIYAGDIDKNKNIEQVAKAVNFLEKKDWIIDLKVIGHVIDQSIATRLSSQKNVSIIPRMNKEKLIFEYRKADIFVMVSHKESFGLVYAEALSQNLPIVYTKGQGFDKQFPNGYVGFAVDDYDLDDLVDTIVKIVDNYSYLSNNCLKASNCFKWGHICDKYCELYEKLIKHN